MPIDWTTMARRDFDAAAAAGEQLAMIPAPDPCGTPDLFAELADEPTARVDEITIVSLGRPDRKVPRDSVKLPAGRDAGSDAANRYTFRVIDHGPQWFSLLPCQYGRSGDCSDGNHGECSHHPGGWQHNPIPQAEGHLMAREADGYWRNLVDQSTGRRVPLLPMHGWRCSCECHDAKPEQLDLFGDLS